MQSEQLLTIWGILFLQGIVILFVLHRVGRLPDLMFGLPPGMRLPNIPVASPDDQTMPLPLVFKTRTMVCIVTKGCPYCERIVPELERLQQTEPGFSIVLLVAGDFGARTAFAEKTGTSLPLYSTGLSLITKQLRVTQMPFGFLVNHKGIILRRGSLSRNTLVSWLVDLPRLTRESEPGLL